MLIDNGWYLILENITCGYGNHAWYIEFISLVACGHSWYKFNISLVITITTRDIFQYQIPAIIYLPIVWRVISLANTLRWSITTTAFVCKIHIKVKVWSCKEKEWKRRRKCRDKKVSFSFLFDRSEPYIFVEFVISH